MGRYAWILFLALAAAGCWNEQDDGDGELSRDEAEIGVRADPDDADDAGETAADRYEVDGLENGFVVLRHESTGEIERQSGTEIRLDQEEFRLLAGREAKPGDVVHVRLDADGKVKRIRLSKSEAYGADDLQLGPPRP